VPSLGSIRPSLRGASLCYCACACAGCVITCSKKLVQDVCERVRIDRCSECVCVCVRVYAHAYTCARPQTPHARAHTHTQTHTHTHARESTHTLKPVHMLIAERAEAGKRLAGARASWQAAAGAPCPHLWGHLSSRTLHLRSA
jgi:hypothetical protein